MTLAPGVRVFVTLAPTDMRGSFDSLAGAARRLGLEPTDGHLYFFLNRRRRLCKCLWHDGSGWLLLSKRLEVGTFELPAAEDGADKVVVDAATLGALLEGIALAAPRRRWYRRSAVA